ncbi:DnaA regulatory inactivator Hda [Teredinibacter franksiae]|jgi:regulatory inactivation of DnaA Hda protein|uniref:DnaA regulatory inactivator Hda n=1 Tax=Teredinibacter franksiae TaxID=2761453 RepID=UPI001625E06E|nr:DnaA regulatory inactivator Hda [Teredinibacter franksiae]
MSPVQLSLGVSLRDDATFDNYFTATESNDQAIFALKKLAQGAEQNLVVIWGARSAGLTHLVQALCHRAGNAQRIIQYFPMADVRGYDSQELCEGLEEMDIVCLDGIEHVCGNRAWEQSLFHLFNRLRDAGKSLLISSHVSPPSLPILLPDLKSRVLGCEIYHIESLTDDGKKDALRMRAAARGMELSEEVASFILNRASRDTVELFQLLNRLDDASLREQRKLTIPFVKEVLGL